MNLSAAESEGQAGVAEVPEEASPASAVLPEQAALPVDDLLLDEATLVNSPALPYALMVTSMIERKTIRREELITALRKRMRQHSIGRLPRREYVLRYLNQHPP